MVSASESTGNQVGLNEIFGLPRQDTAHHDNVFESSGFPQEHAFVYRGHTEPPDAELRQGVGHGAAPMAIPVGLDDR